MKRKRCFIVAFVALVSIFQLAVAEQPYKLNDQLFTAGFRILHPDKNYAFDPATRTLNVYLPSKALLENDFDAYYNIDIERDYPTPLKKKLFMESEKYLEMQRNLTNNHNAIVKDIFHVDVDCKGSLIYDLDRGGFKTDLYIGNDFKLNIPQSLKNKVIRNDAYNLECFIPINNLEIASRMEDDKDEFRYIIRFKYNPNAVDEESVKTNRARTVKSQTAKEKGRGKVYFRSNKDEIISENLKNTVFELYDIVLYNSFTGEIIWSILLGDQSNNQSSNLMANVLVPPSKKINSEEDNNVFDAVEQAPQFLAGNLNKWLSSNIRYPESAQKKGIGGRVVVQFIIERDGSVCEVKVIKGVDKDLDAEASRVVKKMPKWQPGKSNGHPVRTRFTLPINFNIVEAKEEDENSDG